MTRPVVVVAEAVGAVAAVVAAVVCWMRGVGTSGFAPIAPGTPSYTGVHYSGPWIAAAFASVLVAGLLALDVRRRLRT
ncbi:hypothetical protein [Rhodococcus sp. ACT016]|uniref:hypothetical protein n=1 Tax=Rhodococcus sp. ACT016 TaxID=3134808 RepID=UPI003D2666E4